jgi:hypothetical protein
MADAVSALAGSGVCQATLWTLAEVQRTLRFYASAGFAPDGAAKVVECGKLSLSHVRLVTAITGLSDGRDGEGGGA